MHALSKFNLIKDFEGENDVNNSEVILKTTSKFEEKVLSKYHGNLISKEQDFEDEKYNIGSIHGYDKISQRYLKSYHIHSILKMYISK